MKGSDHTQRFQYIPGKFANIHSFANTRLCIDSSGGRNTKDNKIIVWSCHRGGNQQWSIVAPSKRFSAKASGIKQNTKFQIVTKLAGNKVLFYNEHIGGGQYRLRIRAPKGDRREWWIYDFGTRSIRLAADKKFAISNQSGVGLSKGKALVMRKYTESAQ